MQRDTRVIRFSLNLSLNVLDASGNKGTPSTCSTSDLPHLLPPLFDYRIESMHPEN